MKNLLALTKLIKHLRWRIIGITAFGLLGAAINVVRPYIFKLIIDQIVALSKNTISYQQFQNSIVFLAVIFLCTSLGFSLVDSFSWRYTEYTTNHISNHLLIRIFDKLSSLSIGFFEGSRFGETLSKINRGMNNYMNWLNLVTQQLIDPLIFNTVVAILLLAKLPIIGILLIITIAIITTITVKSAQKTQPIQLKESKSYEKAYGIFTESFSNIATIRSIGSLNTISKKFEKAVIQSEAYGRSVTQSWFWSILSRDTIGQLFITSAILVLAWSAFSHQISAGDVVFYLLLIQQVMGRVNIIGRFINGSSRSNTQTGRLVEVLQTEPSLSDEPNAEPLLKLYTIEFKNVSFAYPKSKKGAITDVSFKIENGKTIALVGPSGVGKSTITKLLLRFYAPDSGQILINGEDISTFTQESLRSHIGMVMQDVALFNTTVEENLKLAKPKANREQIQAAARQAHATEFIEELPKSYKTIVGERGIKLSGGQKQRIAIARAILKNPSLIILDEATSALDSESERSVQAGLKELMAGRAALVIAHRLSTVMHATEIIVLKQGRVFERGDHKELLKKNGLYAKLFRLQSSSGQIKL